jgi:hypothetical protein
MLSVKLSYFWRAFLLTTAYILKFFEKSYPILFFVFFLEDVEKKILSFCRLNVKISYFWC